MGVAGVDKRDMEHAATISLLSFCSRSLRLRMASGGYDCRRECASASWWLPWTSHHSCREMTCPGGRHFMMQPLRGRHTPSRHHAVCAVSIPFRPYTPGDGSTALSYAPRHPPPTSAQGTKTGCSLHGITFALILSRHAHKPTLRPIGVNTLSNPHPKPLGGGRVSAGSHERDACLPSKR